MLPPEGVLGDVEWSFGPNEDPFYMQSECLECGHVRVIVCTSDRSKQNGPCNCERAWQKTTFVDPSEQESHGENLFPDV